MYGENVQEHESYDSVGKKTRGLIELSESSIVQRAVRWAGPPDGE